ncbi:hypothetical protein BG53_02810 [Paenibacillus darwinianus]|uniref:Peptidase M56 domain-containing protein n=1 Tax=Paenibacillus darwinianus TaxID=1380763 RepID=A0A9W5W7J1_9BACL|nr:M56 family metallopeptidase [Paenibacillus darwinianus]EXX87949.1 hypothetical protein BG53_02810 [Paenibacillus darwinianus]EXX88367.1 hypothetical protein BG52_02225 [Paenibacillus darwinianus]EXX88404.1 hypothetical protein CH50_03530 [Paenibacillus darwinianus]
MRIRKHHIAFLGMLLIGGLVWSQMVIYLLYELFGFNLKTGFLQYCIAFFRNRLFWHWAVLIGLNAIVIYSFWMILQVLASQLATLRRWNKYVDDHRDPQLTAQLSRKYANRGYEVVVIRHESILALTSGFRRPRVILSSTLVSEFSEREVASIVLHEISHCRHYDPARMLVMKVITDSLPFIPVLKRLSHYIRVWIELEADQYAIRRMGSRADLASVLLRCSRLTENVKVGIGFADEAINYRLLQLIEPQKEIRVPLVHFMPLTISFFVIFFIGMIVVSSCT